MHISTQIPWFLEGLLVVWLCSFGSLKVAFFYPVVAHFLVDYVTVRKENRETG